MKMHVMEQIGINKNGLDIFKCPKCDRLVHVRWTPQYEEHVKVSGNINVVHLVHKDEVFTSKETEINQFWENALNDMNFNDKWKEE
jgi:uncharacterized C2H2 Zn-finger protein